MRHASKWVACLALCLSALGWAFQPSQQSTLASQAFFKPELYLPISNVPLEEARVHLERLGPSAWDDFFARNGRDFHVYLDPLTGTPSAIQGAIPLIPGTGVGNKVTLSTVHQQLGRSVGKVDEAVVADLLFKFISDNQAALGVDLLQLGEPRVTQVTDTLWHVLIPQQLQGIPVRHGRLVATINHGNLVLIGTEAWSNATASTKPTLAAQQALTAGGERFGLLETPGQLWMQPELELAPLANADAKGFGEGYRHQLVWTYGFQNPGEQERWKVTVDAHTGEVLALEDDNHYLDATIKGGIYPLTSTEICTQNEACGTMQVDTPMPWANTGLASPNNFTDGAGVFNYSSGNVTTTLAGKYVRVSDTCGSVSFSSSTGNVQMGGTNGQHDCTTGGGGAGNTPASRSAFYEVNRIAELARGWLPNNTWLQGQLTANVNINSTCNAFWNGSTINFYRSGGGCRNTGEIAAVFDHEWGHGMDDFDSGGALSNSSEGYADIASIYRLQASCVGYGFFHTSDRGCGKTPDGTGYNQNEAQTGAAWCNTKCSGVRDADYMAHANQTPATPQNFVCTKCSSSTGPCGRQVHCAAAPARQAAWDLVARDLQAPPFNYDSNTAFIIGNKIFYQGSGNIGSWHACNCTAGTSDGCGASHGYMQWLAADDDNGNLNDGTPHMTAIHAAFNRHGIACNTPAPANSGCASGPSAAPTATATGSDGQVALSWNAVAGASEYWVMKTEGYAGCDFGKAKVATVTGTAYTDGEVANDRRYCYSVVPASSSACYGPAAACVCATPGGPCTPPGVATLSAPADGATGVALAPALDWADVAGSTSYEVQVATDSAFTNVVRSGTTVGSTWTVPSALTANTQYFWRVRAVNNCANGTYSAAFRFTTTDQTCTPPASPALASPADTAEGVALSPVLDWSDVTGATSYEVQVASDSGFTNVVRSATALATSTWTVSPALTASSRYYWRARAVNGCGAGSYSAPFSFNTQEGGTCTVALASYDASLGTPVCGTGCGCDTGTIVNSRGSQFLGAEPNEPNTLDGCPDGPWGFYHFDESIDRVVLKSVDGGPITPGKQVKVDVTVWCYDATDKLNLYYTPTPGLPTWSSLATGLACTASGAQTFSHTFTVGSGAGQHAIRAQFVEASSLQASCSFGIYDDHDDVVFGVAAAVASGDAPKPSKQGRARATR
ncbi:endopeptidase [Myxococcus sp. RHSTA-1-4]|uniref:endopeptidase n=1 Tax=Myxococcus sp. RHSTA-1-4 TaxID=2874601 RepID=UPI001CBEDEA0|nr:endopeptidase [Myxococcus sp. RHSTA-1-4]MBZ4420854.1 endopeptidase [Myxococcus sp. RHSTA-1-4]